jgi:hypothetical protein
MNILSFAQSDVPRNGSNITCRIKSSIVILVEGHIVERSHRSCTFPLGVLAH